MPRFTKIIAISTCAWLVCANFVFAASTEDRRSYNAQYHDVTSTNFQIKGAAGDPAVGRSTSTGYVLDHGLVIEFGQMTLTVATSVNFGVITPIVPSTVTSAVYVDMVGALNGYQILVERDDAVSTLNKNGSSSPDIIFPDQTAWDPTGAGNAVTNPGNNLCFRVMNSGTNSYYDMTWWGNSDSSGTAKFAGFPAAMQKIMSCASCNFGTTQTVIQYQASAPLSQENGVYTGSITYTALVNP